MKIMMTTVLLAVSMFSSAFADFSEPGNRLSEPTTLYACKKRDTFIYQTFFWAVIEKSEFGHLEFIYGNGFEDQMTNLFFRSPLMEAGPGAYYFDNGDYKVNVTVKNGKMAIQIKNEMRKFSRKGMNCGT